MKLTSSSGLKFETYSSMGRKLLSFGPSGIKLWQFMNEGLVLRWPPSPNNVFFASQTRANQLNIKVGTAFKLGGLGDVPHSSCMSFVVLGPATMIVLIGSKLYLGKGFLRNSVEISKFGTFYVENYAWDHLD